MKNIIDNIKNNKWLLMVVFAIGCIVGLFINTSSHQIILTSDNQLINTSAHQTWTCSMHPQIKQDKPGQCPICAMDLIPLESNTSDEEGVDPNEIEMSEAAMKLAQIQTLIVKKEYSNKEVYLLGKVKPDERNISELTARFGGRIEKLYTNYTGQNVVKGEKLATIYSPELVIAQKELLESIKYKESNPAFYKASRSKLKLWDLTETQIDGIETKGEPQNYFDVLSPISGTVTMRHVSIGDYIKEGNALFQVINLKKVWLMFEAYESDLPWLSEGDKVEFTVQSLPGKTFTGKVTFIDPFLDAKTRVAKVRVEVDNPKLELKPEMFANGIIKPKISGGQKDLMIPKTAVLWTGKRAVVYVKMPERKHNSFLYREITLGPEAGEFYIVKEGLSEGEEIAVNGVFKIDAAAQLEGKPSMMNPDGGKASTGHNHSSSAKASADKGMEVDGNSKTDHSDMDMSKSSSSAEILIDEHAGHQMAANLEHAMFKVSGNCEMCKKTIEKAANSVPGVNSASWSIESKLIHLSFNSEKTNLLEIHKAIANSGYDTEIETASAESYSKLPPCCQYTR